MSARQEGGGGREGNGMEQKTEARDEWGKHWHRVNEKRRKLKEYRERVKREQQTGRRRKN